jgi:pyruvate/2-oxoglutarate/acetoin dehydrogenase E1 component
MNPVTGTRITFEDAVAEALRMEMHRDPSVVCFFSSPGRVARALADSFGQERVIETTAVGAPLVLAASGAAQEGLRVVCELGPGEAGAGALEQIAELAALQATNGGGAVTIRLAWGDVLNGGGAPAVDPLARLIGAEGLKLVEPATAADAKGLIVSAVRDDAPVCVLEHAGMRETVDTVPEGSHVVGIGRARLVHEGEAVSLVAHGAAVAAAEAAVERSGLDADVLDLRSLQPLDSGAVLTSVRRTGRILFIEPAAGTPRVTSELVTAVWEEAFEHLDAPPRRIRLRSGRNGRMKGSAGDDADAVRKECDELCAY